MAESYIMPEQTKTREAQEVSQLLQSDRKAFDTAARQGFAPERYSNASTRREVDYITSLLGDVKTTSELSLGDKEIARLKSIRARGISHLLLNERSRSDSPEMKIIKLRVESLERLLDKSREEAVTSELLDQISVAYQLAMDSCRSYLENPRKRENRRKKAVREAFEALSREYKEQGLGDNMGQVPENQTVAEMFSLSESREEQEIRIPEEKEKGSWSGRKIMDRFWKTVSPWKGSLKSGKPESESLEPDTAEQMIEKASLQEEQESEEASAQEQGYIAQNDIYANMGQAQMYQQGYIAQNDIYANMGPVQEQGYIAQNGIYANMGPVQEQGYIAQNGIYANMG
ncbi:MAG: hypothetical protein IJU50_09295, partial [Lachnospiraceae bacterium]|nr:hypothetical protein [Lachnospiraceae bacterium]